MMWFWFQHQTCCSICSLSCKHHSSSAFKSHLNHCKYHGLPFCGAVKSRLLIHVMCWWKYRKIKNTRTTIATIHRPAVVAKTEIFDIDNVTEYLASFVQQIFCLQYFSLYQTCVVKLILFALICKFSV